jgi:hypothetical protein
VIIDRLLTMSTDRLTSSRGPPLTRASDHGEIYCTQALSRTSSHPPLVPYRPAGYYLLFDDNNYDDDNILLPTMSTQPDQTNSQDKVSAPDYATTGVDNPLKKYSE